MPPTANYQELAQRYGLAPTPACVLQLTQMVARQDSDLDEIARLIDRDPTLQARLLRVANPSAESVEDYNVDTVEGALMRNGIGCAMVLAMGTPLALALVKTFQTMLSRKLETIEYKAACLPPGEHVFATIGFSGKASGEVRLRMSLESAAEIAGTILGMEASALGDGPEVSDAIGEILNIMTGNFKSILCDAGLDCRLQPPQVQRAPDIYLPTAPGTSRERMAFRCGNIQIIVDVAVNPWNDE